jgi:spore maturation protein CgeB
MRFMILDSMSKYWLDIYNKEITGLNEKPFTERVEAISGNQTAHMSWALRSLGHDVFRTYADFMPMQLLYAAEQHINYRRSLWENAWLRRGVSKVRRGLGLRRDIVANSQMKIWKAQLGDFKPDVVYCVSMQAYSPQFLEVSREIGALVIGQIASQFQRPERFRVYDLVISSLPNFVEQFQREGIHSIYVPLGFGSEVLERLNQTERAKVNRVLHIGGYGPIHQERNTTLEGLASAGILDCYGYGIEHTRSDSSLRSVYFGPVVGLETYRLRKQYSVSITKHIHSVSGPYNNNTTMFETTGVGACLLVDKKQNLADFFQPDVEVATYESAEECLEIAKFLLAHPREREEIALAGQARTLKDHTMRQRAQIILKEIEALRDRA